MQKDDQGTDTPVVTSSLVLPQRLLERSERLVNHDHTFDPPTLPTFEEHIAMCESGEHRRRLNYHMGRIQATQGQEPPEDDLSPQSWGNAPPPELDTRFRLPEVPVNPGINPSSMERVHLDVTPSNKTTTKDVRQALEMAAVSLDSLDGSDAGARAQAVMKALAAVKQLEKNQLRKRIKFWLGWFVFFALLGGIGYGGWQWAKPQLATGRYTVPVTCKMEYAGEEMEVRRNFTYPFRSLFGYHLVDEGAVEIEDEVVLQGDKLTILGIKNGRTWRKDYAKGEFGTAKLPNTDIYWFVGEKSKDTKAVTFNTFCN